MSTVADTSHGKKKQTAAIKQLAKEFGFKVRLCGTRKPETKGTVEARNKILDWIRAYEGEFETLEELIQDIEDINKEMNITISQETNMSPTALFYKEKEYLKPLPESSIIEQYLRPNKYLVSNESLIRYNGKKYSVDPKLIDEEVTVNVLDNKLYIYYNGKLITYHELNEKPVNYKPDHYANLMKGKVKDSDFDTVVNDNLQLMDGLLESRTININELEATKSADALIAYLNTSEYGNWIINHYAHLSTKEKLTFIKGVNSVLPYVRDRDTFVSYIKYSLKNNLCKTLDFDCWVNDFMAYSESERILTDEGFEIIELKYQKEIDTMISEMVESMNEPQKNDANLKIERDINDSVYKDLTTGIDLPFSTKENDDE